MKKILKKKSFIGVLIVIYLMMFIHCSSKRDIFENTLYIDPGDINDLLLPVTIETNDKKALKFEADLKQYGCNRINISEYLDIIFRYRDSSLLPIYFSLLNSRNVHPYFRISAIYIIGEIGSASDFDNLYAYWRSEMNDLVREYIASSLLKIADSTHVSILESMAKKEENIYVRKTLETGVSLAKGGRCTRITYLPLLDTTQFCQIKTYPSEKSSFEYSLTARKKIDTLISQYIPIASGFEEYVSPPQYNFQYPMSEVIQTLIDLNFTIKEFKEYPHDMGGGHVYLENMIPLSYHLWATKNC